MANNMRKPIILIGTQARMDLGGTVTAASISAGGFSAEGNIGIAQNITIFIQNNDGSTDSTFTLQAAANMEGQPASNYVPTSTDWYNLYDGTTGALVQWSVGHQTQIAINVPNVAANFIRLSSSGTLSSCIAMCEIAT